MTTEEQRAQLEQAEAILAGQDIGPYTLTDADVDGCKQLLARLIADDHLTGGYRIDGVQGYQGKAQVMIEFAKRVDAMTASEVASRTADSSDKLGLLCKKVIAHYATHGDRLKRLEEFLGAYDYVREMSGHDADPVSVDEYATRMQMLDAARDNLR